MSALHPAVEGGVATLTMTRPDARHALRGKAAVQQAFGNKQPAALQLPAASTLRS
ncbi:MAG: hypothetical protein H7242_21220 [Microbacteriaceae bacterium]|nr:hypothetical protein [Burkholderiaceae bacterium]